VAHYQLQEEEKIEKRRKIMKKSDELGEDKNNMQLKITQQSGTSQKRYSIY